MTWMVSTGTISSLNLPASCAGGACACAFRLGAARQGLIPGGSSGKPLVQSSLFLSRNSNVCRPDSPLCSHNAACAAILPNSHLSLQRLSVGGHRRRVLHLARHVVALRHVV